MPKMTIKIQPMIGAKLDLLGGLAAELSFDESFDPVLISVVGDGSAGSVSPRLIDDPFNVSSDCPHLKQILLSCEISLPQ
jgi:hypothetical protein